MTADGGAILANDGATLVFKPTIRSACAMKSRESVKPTRSVRPPSARPGNTYGSVALSLQK